MNIRAMVFVLGVLVLAPMAIWAQAESAKTRIVAFGDSITEGFGQTPYSVFLQQMLNANECNSEVINEGVRGELSFDGASRIDSVLTKYNPQYILLMEGANDVIIGVSSQITAASLATMMDKASSAGATPIVSSITPNTQAGTENLLIPEEYNPAIKQEVNARGVKYVDNYNALRGFNWVNYQIDGLHLTDQGNNVLAQEFFGILPCEGSGSDGDGGGGCFIATAAYGSLFEPHVVILRRFRDEYLLPNTAGRAFIRMYYKYSPPVADIIRQSELLKLLVRIALLPLIGVSYLLINGLWYIVGFLVLISSFIFCRWTLRRV